MDKKSVCLNMIVKNESRVIERCLASVKNIIDYWVILDTGSTDGTQEIIRKFLKDIPGELHERPWVDFSYNRNEALELAKGKADYFLFIDADEELFILGPQTLPKLNADFYVATYRQEFTDSQRVLLIGSNKKWEWKGVIHEAIYCLEEKYDGQFLDNMIISAAAKDGSRALDPEKYQKEIAILEKALEKEPENRRYVLCLAGAYASTTDYVSALKNYEKRARMGGSDLEVYYSLFKAAVCRHLLWMPQEECINSYLLAYHIRPSRAEPLSLLAKYYMDHGNYFLGYLIAKFAVSIPLTQDRYYTQKWIYDWGLRLQLAECCSELGKKDEMDNAIRSILAVQDLPKEVRLNAEKYLSSSV